MIPKAPSFSIFNSGCNEFGDGDQNPEEEMNQEGLERTVTIGDNIEAIDGSKLSCGDKSMGLIEEEEGGEEQDGIPNLDVKDELARPVSPPMYLATGLGVDSHGFFGFDGDGIDLSRNVEEYYRSMVDVHPFNPLVLRNYAHFLQSNGDLHGAEEYYSRAVLADPEDGEIMAQYAKLIWTLHGDKERTLSYFKRAAETALRDSHVQAAYASFLWEIEDDEEEDDEYRQKLAQNESIEALDISDNIEVNYRKMVENNPNQPLALKNYAQFLYQIKEDPQSAEKYYSRAIQADPEDAETMAEYAKLVWELHHDSEKASSIFEQAVQAAPGNSDVAAAYAHFLWGIEDGEEDDAKQDDQIEVHA